MPCRFVMCFARPSSSPRLGAKTWEIRGYSMINHDNNNAWHSRIIWWYSLNIMDKSLPATSFEIIWASPTQTLVKWCEMYWIRGRPRGGGTAERVPRRAARPSRSHTAWRNYVAVTGCDLESFGSRGMVSDRYVLVCLKGIPVGSVDIWHYAT